MTVEKLAGYDTHWHIDGTGERQALFLHCSLAHSGAWARLMSLFRKNLTMVAMDLPGHGRSGDWVETIPWQVQSAQMAVALMGKFSPPMDIIGHSFGATVALRIAIEHPELVKSLTLVEPVLFSVTKEVARPEFERHLTEGLAMLDLFEKGDLEGVARFFSKLWGASIPWDHLPEKQRAYIVQRIRLIMKGGDPLFSEDGPGGLRLADIAKVDVPVLLVEGGQSHEIAGAIQETLHDTLPDSKRLIVKDAGHMVPITHVNEVGETLRAFLNL